MDQVWQFISEDTKANEIRHATILSLWLKVLSVLLAEAVSNTWFNFLVLVLKDWLDDTKAGALIARSVYAVLISFYAPFVGWLLTKSRRYKGETFVAFSLQFHTSICPVLVAWGWKDWASQLDEWAGPKLWDELIVALVLTSIVTLLQATQCFRDAHEATKSGNADNLRARFLVLPSNLGVTLGYVWNMVATFFVNKVADLNSGYDYIFCIQAAYTVIVAILVTRITCYFSKSVAPQSGETKGTDNTAQLHRWSETFRGKWSDLITGVLAFVYAWAFLDTVDDWFFGVMFKCASYSKCSYQNNFAAALIITVFFLFGASFLQVLKESLGDEPGLKVAIALQYNAMVLTVGWLWMNFYKVFTAAATSRTTEWKGVLIYVIILVAMKICTNLANFILQKSHVVTIRKHKKWIENATHANAIKDKPRQCTISI